MPNLKHEGAGDEGLAAESLDPSSVALVEKWELGLKTPPAIESLLKTPEGIEAVERVVLSQLDKGERWPQTWDKPDPGHWDTHYDFATEQGTPTGPKKVLGDAEEKFFVRFVEDSTDHCPAGPCGSVETIRTAVSREKVGTLVGVEVHGGFGYLGRDKGTGWIIGEQPSDYIKPHIEYDAWVPNKHQLISIRGVEGEDSTSFIPPVTEVVPVRDLELRKQYELNKDPNSSFWKSATEYEDWMNPVLKVTFADGAERVVFDYDRRKSFTSGHYSLPAPTRYNLDTLLLNE